MGSEEFYQWLNDLTVLAKKYMIDEGKMLMGYSSTKGSKYFWRTVMSNPYISEKDVDLEMELTQKYCNQAYAFLIEQRGIESANSCQI